MSSAPLQLSLAVQRLINTISAPRWRKDNVMLLYEHCRASSVDQFHYWSQSQDRQ